MTISCPTNDSTGVCATMDSAGAGLGVFLQYMAQSLPALLIILALVGGIVLVVTAVAYAIKKSMGGSYRTR